MSDLLKEVTSRAAALAPEERAKLAEVMLESLQEGTSAEVDAAWDQELQFRIAAYERGESKLASAKDVFDEAGRLTTGKKSGLSTRRESRSVGWACFISPTTPIMLLNPNRFADRCWAGKASPPRATQSAGVV